MAIAKFVKDPGAKLDYVIDWGAWISGSDTINTVTTVPAVGVASGITVTQATKTNTTTTVWVSGGVAGTSYDVTVHIVTTQLREDERTITIVCKDL